MNQPASLFVALLTTAPFLFAQTDKPQPPGNQPPAKAPQGMPDPKTKEHDELKVFVGDWEVAMKCTMPGKDQPVESKGTEHAELICNGLFLKNTFDGTTPEGPMQGIWVAGYDPFRKVYTWVWADSMDPSACVGEGTYDASKKTWEWRGKSPSGEMRATMVVKDNDTTSETCTWTSAEGVTKSEVTRKRVKSTPPGDAAARGKKSASKEHEVLQQDVGNWEATVKCTMPGQPATEEKGTEAVHAICNGKWLWSDFKGQFMGMPFEGHALYGYDGKEQKYVSHWLDSCSGTIASASGTYDPAAKSFTMQGKGVDEQGKPMTFKQTIAYKGAEERTLNMESKGEKGPTTMTIVYKRLTKN